MTPRTLPKICTSKNYFMTTLKGINYCILAMNEKEIKCQYLKPKDHNNLRPCSFGKLITQN